MTTTDETTETATTETAEEVQEQQQEAPVDSQLEGSKDPEADDATEDQQDDGSKASREAAKYRRQLRDTESERDALQAQVATMRTAIAEEALTGVLAKPSSLWLTGIDPNEFYDAEGNLDTEALANAARQASQEHGLAPHKRFQGSADGGSRESTAEVPRRFSDMFKPAS